MKENLLIMICSLNEAKIVLQCGNKSIDRAAEEPHRHCTLLTGAFHLTDRKLHLRNEQYIYRESMFRIKVNVYILYYYYHPLVIMSTPCLQPVDDFLPPGLWYGMAH